MKEVFEKIEHFICSKIEEAKFSEAYDALVEVEEFVENLKEKYINGKTITDDENN